MPDPLMTASSLPPGLWRAVFGAAPVPTLILDSRRQVLEANAAAAALYAEPREALVGRPIAGFLSDALLAAEYGPLGGTQLPAHRHRRADGSEFLAEVSLAPLPGCREPLLVAVVRDVSNDPRGHKLVRLSEQRWQFALESCGHGLWEWKPLSGEMFASSRFLEQLGFESDDLPPLTFSAWESRVHPDDFERVRRAIRAHFSEGAPWIDVEVRLLNRQGQYRWMDIRGRAMERNGEGRVIRVIGTVRDVHLERLRMAHQRAQQEQLLQSQRMAGLGEMATALAHELNQPLAALGNFSAVLSRRLKGKVDDPDVNRCLDNISLLVGRAGDIVRRIRDFTRKGGLQVGAVDLNQLVAEMAKAVEFQACFLNADVVLDLAPDLPGIEGDHLQLGQLVLNLAKNGLEAMADVPGRRLLSFRTRSSEPGQVELAVEDLGSGLPDYSTPEMFEPFTTNKAGGVGLGLAICRTIVEHHGGRLWATPNHPQGTAFHIVLPLKQGS